MYQKRTETVPYVETANTSHSSGERNCGQITLELGIGKSHQANQTRPTWKSGKMPAQTTAKIVMASAARLIEVRHPCFNKQSTAEINVPAWPIPIQKTKLTIAQPQLIGFASPQTPTPVLTSQSRPRPVKDAVINATAMQIHHHAGVFVSTIRQILSVTQLKSRLLVTRGCSFSSAGCTLANKAA